MKTFSTNGTTTEPTQPPSPDPADIESADQDEALNAYVRPRTVTLPGREPLDLEAISDLWLD